MLNATVSVLVADYVFIMGGYRLVIAVASWWKKRSTTDGKSTLDQTELIANLCEGCRVLKKNLQLDTLSGDNVGDGDSQSPLIPGTSE